MTLDEAIRHAEEVAENCDGECADEHRQLAEWLDELWRARKRIELLKILRDGFKADAQKYKDENDRLRELITGAYETMDAWQMVIANGSDTWGYGKGCLEQLWKLQDDMRELGIEVE